MENEKKDDLTDLDELTGFLPNFSNYHPPQYTQDPIWSRCPPYFAWNAPLQSELNAHQQKFIREQEENYIKAMRDQKRSYEEQMPFSRQSPPRIFGELNSRHFSATKVVKSEEFPVVVKQRKDRRFSV